MSRLPVDADAIRALADILTETGLTEIEVAEKDMRVRVVRAPAPIVSAAVAAAPVAAAAAMPAAAAASAPVSPAAAVAGMSEGELARHPGAVTSPMVGIAFLTPEPGSPPFVAPGQTVGVGQTLLLIEAMKTFNQIKAHRAGTLSAMLVTSGSPVEFGEVLAVID